MSRKILLIDDEDETRETLKIRLEESEFTVLTATNGEEGLKAIESDKPDLIILDLTMPVMDGYTLLKELGHKENAKDIPVFVITARDKMKDMCEMEGVTDFLIKPFEGEDLVTRVSWALKRLEKEKSQLAAITPKEPPRDSKKILIVEDEPDFAEMLRVRLQSANYSASVVPNGEEAIQFVKANRPHLIIMDVMMPKMDGYSTLKEINKFADPRIPIIIMTGAAAIGEEEYRIEGASAFLRKPINGGDLAKQVKEILGDT